MKILNIAKLVGKFVSPVTKEGKGKDLKDTLVKKVSYQSMGTGFFFATGVELLISCTDLLSEELSPEYNYTPTIIKGCIGCFMLCFGAYMLQITSKSTKNIAQ